MRDKYSVFKILSIMNILCLFPMVLMVMSKLKCKVIKKGDPKTYYLSEETIRMTERKESKVFQVFDCTCPHTEDETFGDDAKDDFDTNYYKKDEVDWAESQLIRVSDCEVLTIDLGADTADSLHKTMSLSKIAIIIENVNKLDILSLDIGYGATSSNQREKVASIIFRNLVIMESRYDLKFEDKAEVVFENITFTNSASLDIYNRDMAIAPTFKLIACKFKGDVDIVKEGLNPGSINKIRVESDHVINNCIQNSSAITIIQENRLGFLSSGDIGVKGGKTLNFMKNMMEFVQDKSIEILDVKSIDISENYFGFPISGEPLSIAYSDMTPRCLSGPIPYSSIEEIQVRGVYSPIAY